MYRAMMMSLLVGVAMAVPLVEDQKQQTALENTARTLAAEEARTDGGVTAVTIVNIGIVLAIIWVVLTLLTDTAVMPLASIYGGTLGGGVLGQGTLIPSLNGVSPGRSLLYRSFTEAVADNSMLSGMFSTVVNSIDPVEMSFRFMEIENNACRKRTLCELSATPLIGQFVRYISPSINSLTEYQDAMSAGEALQDCALLFAECPRTSNLSGIKNE